MEQKLFQSIFDRIHPFLLTKWNRICFYAAYTTGSYSIKFFIDDGENVIDCLRLPDITRDQWARLLVDLDRVISKERDLLSDPWTVMTMIVHNDGKFTADFDYQDISENYIDYIREWESKFL